MVKLLVVTQVIVGSNPTLPSKDATMPYKNKEDERAYQRRWYNKNKRRLRAPRNLNRRRLTQHYKAVLARYKRMKGCFVCGEQRPWVLDFRAESGHEDKAVSLLVFGYASWQRIKAEALLCVVVCANCHRDIHYHKKEG